MDGGLPFGYTHTQKRSHAQMELEGSSSPTWGDFNSHSASREPSASAAHPQHAGLHLPRLDSIPTTMPRRWPGDGLDYRRPMSSANVIDLTDEDAGPSTSSSDGQRMHTRPPRQPRFGREIMRDVIDVDAEDARRATAPAPSSPDIEIISSRRIDPPRRMHLPPLSRENVDEDEVEFVSENPLPEALRRHTAQNSSIDLMQAFLRDAEARRQVPHLRAHIERRANAERAERAERQRQATMDRLVAQIRGDPRAPPRARRAQIHIGFRAPNVNYGVVGFDLGLEESIDRDDAPVAPPPTYNAPVAAPEGFTRSPQEQDTLVCPNCGDELCAGDSDLKKQVWIVKACGHVYCGECTANRSIRKSAKGKEKQASVRTKPFKECAVDGCQKKVTHKSQMIQIFL